MSKARIGLLPLAAATAIACGSLGGGALRSPGEPLARATGDSRPPIAIVAREGDAQGAIAVAVTTVGIANERGALPAVALAALVQRRMQDQGFAATAVGGWNGWRMQIAVGSPSEAARAVGAARAALLTPVAAGEPALAAVARRAAALAQRPLADESLVDFARCTGDAFGLGADATSDAELEVWRAAAHGLGRVAMAASGSPEIGDAAARALSNGAAWPRAAPIANEPWPSAEAGAAVYDASGEIAPAAARIVITARTASPERAVAAASILGDPRGALAARLAGLEAPARLRSVVATAHVDGGCLAATIDLQPAATAPEAAASVATAAALSMQEIAFEMGDVAAQADLGRDLAVGAADPRESALRAAWWSLAGRRSGVEEGDLRLHLVVGVAPSRSDPRDSTGAPREAVRAEIDRAMLAWRAPVIEARTRVERGQGEMWILLASPCGTLSESGADAGASAAVALAAAAQAERDAAGVQAEPLVAADAIGLLVHGPARRGESPEAHARRLADAAARAFAAESLAPEAVARARVKLLSAASSPAARTRTALASALAPGHPSWIEPSGTLFGVAAQSDDAIEMRAAAIRAGPLRVAVLANVDSAQADAAVRSVDRWVARRPGELRVCPPAPGLPAARGGTYAVERADGPSEALLAAALPGDDESSRAAAIWIAAALDGADGLLAHALGGVHPGPPGNAGDPLAQGWGATVVGLPRAPAIVVRIEAQDEALDAAVAQTRALLDRLRQGALREEDRARATRSIEKARAEADGDPRARTVELWRGARAPAAPSLDALRAFAAAVMHDEALVIVAARPPVLPAAPPRAFPAHDTAAK